MGDEEYTNALVAAVRAFQYKPKTFFSVQGKTRDKILKLGEIICAAAEVASSPEYRKLSTASKSIEDSIGYKDRGYDSTICGQLLGLAYSGVESSRRSVEDVKDDELEGSEQLKKLAFIETLVAYTFTDTLGRKVGGKTKSSDEKKLAIARVMDARNSISGIRNNILGWVRQGAHETLKKRYGLETTEVEQGLLVYYTNKLFLNPRAKGGSIFCINPLVLGEINEEIIQAEEAKKLQLQQVKKVLGGLTQAIYTEIDRRIDDGRLGEIEQIMREQINSFGQDSRPRDRTVVLINGHPGAGKGTTLEMLGTQAVETGTDGIAGRGKGYSQYELVMAPYDLARANGELVPPKLMKLLFVSEMLYQRQLLDQQNRIDAPVYVSGFPRNPEQAEIFRGINNVKSIALTITPETAVTRTLTRIAMAICKEESPREDDLNDLVLSGSDNKQEILNLISDFVLSLNCEVSDDRFISTISKKLAIDKSMISNISMAEGSRYRKYDKVLNSIIDLLERYCINTVKIDCNGKTPVQVTDEVRRVIG